MFLIVSTGCNKTVEDTRGRELLDSAERDYLVGEYVESLKSIHEYIQAVNDGEIEATPELDSKAYKFLGNIHYIFDDRPGAIKSYDKALQSSLQTGNSEEQLKLLFNLSIVNSTLNREEESKKYIDKIANISGTDPWLRTYFRTLASAYHVQAFGDSTQFIKMMQKSLRIVEEHDLETYLKFNPYEEIFTALEHEGKYDEALAVLKQYENALEESGESPERMVSCLRMLMNIYLKIGDRKNALDCQTRYVELSDSLKDRQRYFKVDNLFKQYSLDELPENTSYISKTTDRNIIIYTSVFTALLLSTGLLTWKVLKNRRKTDKKTNGTVAAVIANTNKVNAAPEPVPVEQETLHPELFEKAVDIVDNPEHFSNPKFSVEILATMLGSNVKYVSQSVRSHTGDNFRAFLNARRIKEACAIPDSEEEISIHDVALRVGFLSQSSFIAAFRRETGVTPSLYIKSKCINQT